MTRKVTLDEAVDLDNVARATEGFSGADLQALIYNANLEAVHASISIDIAGPSSRDEEEPVDFTTFGGSNPRAVSSKADKMALEKRVRYQERRMLKLPDVSASSVRYKRRCSRELRPDPSLERQWRSPRRR